MSKAFHINPLKRITEVGWGGNVLLVTVTMQSGHSADVDHPASLGVLAMAITAPYDSYKLAKDTSPDLSGFIGPYSAEICSPPSESVWDDHRPQLLGVNKKYIKPLYAIAMSTNTGVEYNNTGVPTYLDFTHDHPNQINAMPYTMEFADIQDRGYPADLQVAHLNYRLKQSGDLYRVSTDLRPTGKTVLMGYYKTMQHPGPFGMVKGGIGSVDPEYPSPYVTEVWGWYDVYEADVIATGNEPPENPYPNMIPGRKGGCRHYLINTSLIRKDFGTKDNLKAAFVLEHLPNYLNFAVVIDIRYVSGFKSLALIGDNPYYFGIDGTIANHWSVSDTVQATEVPGWPYFGIEIVPRTKDEQQKCLFSDLRSGGNADPVVLTDLIPHTQPNN